MQKANMSPKLDPLVWAQLPRNMIPNWDPTWWDFFTEQGVEKAGILLKYIPQSILPSNDKEISHKSAEANIQKTFQWLTKTKKKVSTFLAQGCKSSVDPNVCISYTVPWEWLGSLVFALGHHWCWEVQSKGLGSRGGWCCCRPAAPGHC